MTPAERRRYGLMHLIDAIAYRATDSVVRFWVRYLVENFPRRGPLVIVCAADGAGQAAHDSAGGSSKTVLCTERDVRAALARHAELIPDALRGRIEVRAYRP